MPTWNVPGSTARIEPEVPDNLIPVLAEFTRLADEASALIANNRLFPGLSTLAGISPIVAMLTDFCASRVIPDIDTGSLRISQRTSDLFDQPCSPGTYL